MPHQILIVEDDPNLASMVQDFLTEEGFQIEVDNNGLSAVSRILSHSYQAIVLDINLPGMNGFDVCRKVRNQFDGPIIVLTARGDEVDEVVALDVGADDFMSKPVRPRALLARLKSHLRRTDRAMTGSETDPLLVGEIAIHRARREATLREQLIELTTAEFDLLEFLAERAGTPASRQEIYLQLLELPYDGQDRSIDLRVSRLRRKLGDDPNNPQLVKSVRGVGYLLAK
ncbi:MAG: response regulator transcription factor [Planctomycetota bacterium]|nr:response regulator transcription factor [Planctomycetota bacterium]